MSGRLPDDVVLIGLKGDRKTGKSSICDHLVSKLGFVRMHPFDGGRAASAAFFEHVGASWEDALRMVHGDLKDVPSPILPPGPDGTHHDPRFYMEHFGAFMGSDLGPSWTLEAEVYRHLARGAKRIVSESIVFEADMFRSMGGVIVEIFKPKTQDIPIGFETDKFSRGIRPDHVFMNDFCSIEDARNGFMEFLLREEIVRDDCLMNDLFPEMP